MLNVTNKRMQLIMTVSHEVNLAGFTVTKVKRIFSVSVPIIRAQPET